MGYLRNRLAGVLAGLLLAAGIAGTAWAGKDRFVVDNVAEPSSLDPHLQWNPDSYYVYRNIFDNLVTRDDDGKIVPEVATSWTYLSDTEIEFKLRDDIRFHDGRKLTAEDVVYSVKRITEPKFASPQLGQYNKIIEASAPDATTVRMKTDGAYPVLMAQLVKLSIVPKHVVEAVGKDAFNLKPVGSGPYKFDNWQRGVSVTLTRNDAYWGRKGPFPTVVFRAVPDAATRLADLQAGAADLVVRLDSDLAAQLEKSPRAKKVAVLTERLGYLRLNPMKPPFDNLRVREAIAQGVDKQGLTDGILGGFEKPLGQMVTPEHFGWIDGIDGLPFDAAKAKAHVAAAGAAGKMKINFLTAPFFDQRIVQAIQQMLADVGLNVAIEMTDTANFLKQIQLGAKDGPQLAIVTSSCACQDADGSMIQLFHSGNSWTIVDNADLDRWLDEARSTLDEKKRLENYRKVHTLIAKDVPVVPLYQMGATYGAAKALVWKPTPNESLFLNRMSWAD